VRGRREVVVCERGDRVHTLRHEGWHLVQSLCLGDRPWLGSEEVARRLSRQDRRELQLLVRPEQWPREAEARVMAQLPNAAYLDHLDRACSGTGGDPQLQSRSSSWEITTQASLSPKRS
jgi:hypothetical protein